MELVVSVDLGLLAAHDPRERDRAVGVRDQQIGRIELPDVPVERPDLLALLRPPHHDPAAVQRVVVECMQRVSEREHHVVRHVHDIRDRTNAGRPEPRLQPDRRLGDRHVPEETADIARGALRILDPDVHEIVAILPRLGRVERDELAVEECGHLSGDPVHREQVGAVSRRLDVEHLFDERQHVGERRARLERVVEQHDSGVVGAEVDLVLGEDHPVGHLAAQLAPLERQTVRERRAGERDGDRRAGAEVPGAADDLVRLRPPPRRPCES